MDFRCCEKINSVGLPTDLSKSCNECAVSATAAMASRHTDDLVEDNNYEHLDDADDYEQMDVT